MDTDHLIRTLIEDVEFRSRPVGAVLAMALLVALPVSAAMLLVTLGVRPDVMTAMHNPFFDLKFAVTLALALPAIAISLHLSRPETSVKRLAMAVADSGGTSRGRHRGGDDDAATAACYDADDRQEFAGLPGGDPAAVAAVAGGSADSITSRRAGQAWFDGRFCGAVVGWSGGHALRFTLPG